MRRAALVALTWSLLSVPVGGKEIETLTLSVEPGEAGIGLLYDGVQLRVSTEAASDVAIAGLLKGPCARLELQKMERVWGLFWAPTDDVTFENVPSLYLVRSSTDLENLADPTVLQEIGLGYDALRNTVRSEAQGELFSDLIRLKESEGRFLQSAEGVRTEAFGTPDRKLVKVTFDLPAATPMGEYQLLVMGFRNGVVVSRGEGTFVLRQTRLIAFLSGLAQEHGLLYGLLAVVVAVGAGLVVGFLYGSGHRH